LHHQLALTSLPLLAAMADTAAQYVVGGEVEAYWPDDDTWLAASLLAKRGDGTLSIAWEEDGSVSEVPADYVRVSRRGLGKTAAERSEHLHEESTTEGSGSDDSSSEQGEVADMGGGDEDGLDALLAAAAAAGACDEADAFVHGQKPPCAMHWAKVLTTPCSPARETADEERKRCRPLGLMTSAQAWSLAATLGPKRARRHV